MFAVQILCISASEIARYQPVYLLTRPAVPGLAIYLHNKSVKRCCVNFAFHDAINQRFTIFDQKRHCDQDNTGPFMDNYRGINADRGADAADTYDTYEEVEADEAVMDAKHAFGTDERRMHVRAYNFWASMLGDNSFPSIEDLNPAEIEDFGPQSVLLDFTAGLENPAIQYLGEALAEECGIDDEIAYIDQVPARSLLSRITDHYMQIIANQAPIGFEAEFVNQRGNTILYRGILLPFSSDDDTIDFICGVINWKEMADQAMTDQLMNEVDMAIAAAPRNVEQVPVWADGPLSEDDDEEETAEIEGVEFTNEVDHISDLPVPDFGESDDVPHSDDAVPTDENMPKPSFASLAPDFGASDSGEYDTADDDEAFELSEDHANAAADDAPENAPLDHPQESESKYKKSMALELSADEVIVSDDGGDDDYADTAEQDDIAKHADTEHSGLADLLQQARSVAMHAQTSEDRSRAALYDAVGRAYDFSVIAAQQPEEFDELLQDAGVSMQERAPMTPIVKLVFGVNYDKTRLTEYATALSHAHRENLPVGGLSEYLAAYKGGLKAVVREERRLRREEDGTPSQSPDQKLQDAYENLRNAWPMQLDDVECGDNEFVVLVARRDENGKLGIVAAVTDDEKFTDKVVTYAAS